MTVLVTGAAGFIGSHVAARLVERGDTVVAVDNFDEYYAPTRKWQNIADLLTHPRFRLYELDVRDRSALEQVFANERIRQVVHLAALAGVRASFADPKRYHAVNVEGTRHVLDVAARAGVENVVFASSSSVYGAHARLPFAEEDPIAPPLSPYAATKRAGEILCADAHRRYGLHCTCLRFFTVYGPRGRPDMAPYRFARALLEGTELTMYGDGSSRRDYTHVDDIVAGTLAALDARLPFEIVNLGNARPVALRDFIGLLERVTGRVARIKQLPEQPGDLRHTFASITKAQRLLGYAPRVGLEEGLAQFVAWYETAVLEQPCAPSSARRGYPGGGQAGYRPAPRTGASTPTRAEPTSSTPRVGR